MDDPLILASSSPRRRRLLQETGLSFRVMESGLREEVEGSWSPARLCLHLARQKAERVVAREAEGWVMGFDTLVVCRRRWLGKPAGRQEARAMLLSLRGRIHHVLTAVALIHPGRGYQGTGLVRTSVRMRHYGEEELETYLDSGEPYDKAGAYAVQGRGGALVEEVRGCYNNVVGLPLCELALLLSRGGADILIQDPWCRLPGGGICPRWNGCLHS